MVNRLPYPIILFAALLFSTGSLAQTPLTEEDVNKYISSIQQLESLSEQINEENPEDAANMAELWIEGDTQALLSHLKTRDYFAELENRVQEAGFDNAAAWVEIAQRVTRAYTALEIGEEGESIAAQMQEGLRQIEDAEYLSQEQKAALTEQLKSSQAQLAGLESVPEEDKKVVASHMNELREQFEQGAGQAELQRQ